MQCYLPSYAPSYRDAMTHLKRKFSYILFGISIISSVPKASRSTNAIFRVSRCNGRKSPLLRRRPRQRRSEAQQKHLGTPAQVKVALNPRTQFLAQELLSTLSMASITLISVVHRSMSRINCDIKLEHFTVSYTERQHKIIQSIVQEMERNNRSWKHRHKRPRCSVRKDPR